MLERPSGEPRGFEPDVRLEFTVGITPEYARFLYGYVGGPWRWIDRLHWTRKEWEDELAVPGTEFGILYGAGLPLGYVQLQATRHGGSSHVEIRYFGLAEAATGRGLGGRMLEHAVQAAWSLPERHELAPASRVWVHTCDLDGPAALPNYRARGFILCRTDTSEEEVPDAPLGSWASTGGPGAARPLRDRDEGGTQFRRLDVTEVEGESAELGSQSLPRPRA